MSMLGPILSGSGYFGSGYGITEGGPSAILKPEIGDGNAEQLTGGELRVAGPASAGQGFAQANAATVQFDMGGGVYGQWNGTGFSLISPPWGVSSTYRAMDDQPSLKLVRRLMTVPIEASEPTVQAVPGKTPKEQWVQFIKDALLPQMGGVVHHGLRMMSYGCSFYRERWDARDGRLWPTLIPHPYDRCLIYRYSNGNGFAGVRYAGAERLWSPANCLLVSHDVEADNLWGHSEHDASYEPWCRWLQMRMDAQMLRAKLSGVIPIVYFPPGQTLIDGKPVDNAVIADQLIAPQLSRQLGIRLPTSGFNTQQILQKPELATAALWKIDFYNAGNLATAQSGFIESMSYEDVQMIRGWGTPERSAIEGQHGTKAEAGQHSDNATQTKQMVANGLVGQVTRGQPAFGVWGSVDKALLFNFGAAAVGTVEIKAASIADTDLENQAKLLNALLTSSDPNLVGDLLDMLGGDGVAEAFRNFGFNPRGELDTGAIKQRLQAAANQRNVQAQAAALPADPDDAGPASSARQANQANGRRAVQLSRGLN